MFSFDFYFYFDFYFDFDFDSDSDFDLVVLRVPNAGFEFSLPIFRDSVTLTLPPPLTLTIALI